jgi:hypothetical protein
MTHARRSHPLGIRTATAIRQADLGVDRGVPHRPIEAQGLNCASIASTP